MVRVEDLMDFVNQVNSQKGRHIRKTLTKLEEDNQLTPEMRKLILDLMNDYTRDILRSVGYNVER